MSGRNAKEAVKARSQGRCELRAFPGCTGVAESVHHRLPRRAGGPMLPMNLLHACQPCHDYVERGVRD